jgi:hypothetical protein
MVKRYDPVVRGNYAQMKADNHGDWVDHAEYVIITAELAEYKEDFNTCYKELEVERKRADELQAEVDGSHDSIIRQDEILTGVANALKGPPDDLMTHSHHDLAEVAQRVVGERDALIKALKVYANKAEWSVYHGAQRWRRLGDCRRGPSQYRKGREQMNRSTVACTQCGAMTPAQCQCLPAYTPVQCPGNDGYIIDQLRQQLADTQAKLEAAEREVAEREKLLRTTQELLKDGAEGAIIDTVWHPDMVNCTLWEAIEYELESYEDRSQRKSQAGLALTQEDNEHEG